MNLYAYCGNNPVNWIDPWGLLTIGIGTSVHGGALGGVDLGYMNVIDLYGNYGIIYYGEPELYLGASGSITRDFGIMKGNLADQSGLKPNFGASAGEVVSFGTEVYWDNFGDFWASGGVVNLGVGGGIPVEAHGGAAYIVIIQKGNIFQDAYDYAMATVHAVEKVTDAIVDLIIGEEETRSEE